MQIRVVSHREADNALLEVDDDESWPLFQLGETHHISFPGSENNVQPSLHGVTR
jgi:hypothetical protein